MKNFIKIGPPSQKFLGGWSEFRPPSPSWGKKRLLRAVISNPSAARVAGLPRATFFMDESSSSCVIFSASDKCPERKKKKK